MKQLWPILILRVVAIAGAVLAVIAWLQQQHLPPVELEHALIALVLLGYLALWVTQGRRH